MSTREVYYFGCKFQPGHFLVSSRGSVRDAKRERLPSDYHLDGGPLFLPSPERVGDGALTYLPACNLTILAWWGSPWDARGAVNTAVLVRGQFVSEEAVWAAFEAAFPEIAKALTIPNVVARWSVNR